MRRRLEILVLILTAATFVVPMIVAYHSYIFPFIVPKILWFRGFTLAILGSYSLLLLINYEKYRVRSTWLTWAVLAYLVSLIFSTFTSVDWYRSFWDNHERMLGLFTLLHFVGYYLVLTHVIKLRSDWQWLLRLFMAAASVVMLVGVAQKIDPQVLLNNGSDRVAGTLGNAIYLGGYGLFLVFLSWYAGTQEKQTGWRVYAALSGILGLSGLLFSGTRGTLIGFVVGSMVALGIYAWHHRAVRWVHKAVWGGLAATVILVGILYAYRETNFVRGVPAVGSLLNTRIGEGTGGTRIMAWKIAVEAWKERPVFGWGINNFFYAFNQYYQPEFLEHGWGETWFDNAHNIVVNTLAAQGAVGVITYLAIFGCTIICLVRVYRKKTVDVHMLVFGAGFLVAHLTQAVFVFENPTSSLYLFFTLAFLNWAVREKIEATTARGERVLSIPTIVVTVVVVFLAIYTTDMRVAKANTTTLRAIQLLYSNPTESLRLYHEALAAGTPHVDDVRSDFARSINQVVPQYVQAKRQDLALQLFKTAYEGLKQNRQLHPYDIRNQIDLAQMALYGAQLEQKPSYFLEALEALEDALRKSPKRQQVQYLLAGVYVQTGQTPAAIKILEEALHNDEKIDGSWWRLALVYRDSGNKEKAKSLIKEADSKGVKFEGQGIEVRKLILDEK